MWYLIVLTLSVSSNSWAMYSGEITVHRDQPVTEDGRTFPNNEQLWALAIEYHEVRRSRELQEGIVSKSELKDRPIIIPEEKNIYARCIAYLNAHKENAALSISQDRCTIVHGLDNQLVVIPYQNGPRWIRGLENELVEVQHTVENQEPIILNIKNDSDEQREFVASSIRNFYKIRASNVSGESIACTLQYSYYGNSVFAVDNQGMLREWRVEDNENPQSEFMVYTPPIPGIVTAIRDMHAYGAAIFYRDAANVDRVGVAISKIVHERDEDVGLNRNRRLLSALTLLSVRNVTQVKAKNGQVASGLCVGAYGGDVYRVCAANGFSRTYVSPIVRPKNDTEGLKWAPPVHPVNLLGDGRFEDDKCFIQ